MCEDLKFQLKESFKNLQFFSIVID